MGNCPEVEMAPLMWHLETEEHGYHRVGRPGKQVGAELLRRALGT